MKEFFTYQDKILKIYFSTKIEFVTSNFLSKILIEISKKDIKQIILNLSSTKLITLPAANFILCFVVHLNRTINRDIDTRIIIESEKVISYLMSLFFFSQMNIYGNLRVPKEILDEEHRIKEEKLSNDKKSTPYSLIFPISVILESREERYFDYYTHHFTENFNDFYSELCQNPIFGFSNNRNESQELFGALYENIKNIFNHSIQLGFGSIHSSIKLKGTIITFFDIGEGIINSVFDSGKFKDNIEYKAVNWALEKGNSSKGSTKNHGIGFTIIKEFVDKKHGLLTIRTDKYTFTYSNGILKKPSINGSFPGTQIVIYTPINN